jgi:methyl-accepting chemotaxis protein
MLDDRLLQTSVDRLLGISGHLGSYLADSEQVFLLAGERLSVLQQRAMGVVAVSSASAEVAGRDDESVDRLESGLADLKRCLGESRTVLEDSAGGLVRVLAGIDQLGRFRGEFQRSAVSLWSLAISMRVENARFGEGGSGFETVVADVRRLGARIEQKFDEMMRQATALHGSAESALARAKEFLERDATALVRRVDGTRESVSRMRAMRASAAGIRQSASTTSEQIAGEVTKILLVLQMHDIARQAMEHVREELEGLGPSADLANVAATAGLQAAQLAHARETLANALDEIARRLTTISGAAVGLSQETQQMGDLREGTDLFGRIDSGIEASSEALREQLSRERFTTSAMCRVSAAMRDLGKFANEIDNIGAEVKLIALNAQVQAEKSGEHGRSMAVLARAIRELSVDVDRETTAVGGVMAEISEEASRLRREQASEAATATTLGHAVEDMSAMLAELHQHYSGLFEGITRARAAGAELRADVESLARQLDQQARAARALSAWEDALREVAEEATAACGVAAVAAAAEKLGKAAKRYTMEQERAIHRAVTQASGAAHQLGSGAPRADLAPLTRAPASDAGGLGDNVELF